MMGHNGPPPTQMLHDVKVVRKTDYSQATVVPVPPEEFVIERGARSNAKEANYCCHKVVKTGNRSHRDGVR